MCFKYQEFIKDLEIECPPNDCVQEKRDSFRFFKDIKHKDNFLPPFIIKPSRVNRKSKDDPEVCSGYALSFFVTLESAKEFFTELLDQRFNAYELIGKYVAKGTLDENDGVMSNPDSDGHFDLHEFVDVILDSKFEVVDAL